MKFLLTISAVVEAAVGTSLLILPGFTALTLLGVPLDTPAGLVAGRIAGSALGAVAITCWTARNGPEAQQSAVIAALLFYNLAAVVVLAYAGLSLGLSGPLLWPTIVLHLALAVWCCIGSPGEKALRS